MATASADIPQQSMYEKVEQVNAILQSQEPENISVDTYGGYTGYKPQYIINAMNRVFGLGKWGFKELSNETRTNEKGDAQLVIAKVQVWIDGVNWQPETWGQNRVTKGDLGDADKGADTDGMKKGLSYFSVGSRAFEGKLPADDALQYKKDQEEQARQRKQGAQSRAANTNGNARQQEQTAKPVQQFAPVAPRQQQPAKAQQAPAEPAPIASIPTFAGLRKSALKYLDEMTFEAVLKDFIRDRRIKPDHEFTPDDVVELQKILMPMIKEAKTEAAKATPVAS